ncbi:MAG: hypothetical protein WD018_08750 [Nitrosopumilaceae archaeon]
MAKVENTEQLVLKKESNSSNKSQSSICDLMKNNTSEILQKMEYQIPTYLQGYTDLFTKYLHSLNTLYGTCYISEKQFFDKLGIDHKVLEPIDEYWKFIKNLTLVQIETSSKFVEDYIQFRIAAIESFDKSMGSALDYYAKALSEFNKKK